MVEMLIIPGAIMLFLLTWAAAETAVITSTMRNAKQAPRVEPVCDMSPLTGKRSAWYAVWPA
jgi:hypothetical protein